MKNFCGGIGGFMVFIKQSNRFCCDCIKNGKNIYSEETIKNRNK